MVKSDQNQEQATQARETRGDLQGTYRETIG